MKLTTKEPSLLKISNEEMAVINFNPQKVFNYYNRNHFNIGGRNSPEVKLLRLKISPNNVYSINALRIAIFRFSAIRFE